MNEQFSESNLKQGFIKNLGDGIALEMLSIPAGTFLMGSPKEEIGSNENERPQHSVSLPAFYMSKFTITSAQWRAVTHFPKVNRDLSPTGFFPHDPNLTDNHPLSYIPWDDSVEFCRRLSQKTGQEYRLPSEAEWEYACRAGTQSRFHTGDTEEDLNFAGWYKNNSDFGPHPVGKKKANAFGLHDMHGNIKEWCADNYFDNYQGAPTNEKAWLDDSGDTDERADRVVRGGMFLDNPDYCRSAYRHSSPHDSPHDKIGIRVVCTTPRKIPNTSH